MPVTDLPPSVFARSASKTWAHRWHVEIEVGTLLAGTPGDPKVVEGYLRSKLRGKSDEAKAAFIDAMAQKVVVEIEESMPAGADDEKRAELVIEEVARRGGEIFKRDPRRDGEIFEEGRKVAAMLKEAASQQWPNARSGRPEVMSRNAKQWWPEHVYVVEDRIHLGRFEVDDMLRRVVHTTDRFGEPQSGFAMHEVIYGARLAFTIASDADLPIEAWELIFNRAEVGGFGAARSMGYGRFSTVAFEKL